MIKFDEMKDKNKLSLWWEKMFVDTLHSYPLKDFSIIDDNFKMKTCVDIGCNVGCFSYLASNLFSQVVAFEPGYYTSVVARMKLNQKEKIQNVYIHNLAVGKNTGDIVKLQCDSHQGEVNSGNASIIYGSKTGDYELVMTISLEKIYDLIQTDFIDYLKIDCEGAEYDILLGKDLSRIGIIAGEIHKSPFKEFEIARKNLLDYISKDFNLSVRQHNFFAVNKKFNIKPELLFKGIKHEA
jgi:FkbM family methyltransferase